MYVLTFIIWPSFFQYILAVHIYSGAIMGKKGLPIIPCHATLAAWVDAILTFLVPQRSEFHLKKPSDTQSFPAQSANYMICRF